MSRTLSYLLIGLIIFSGILFLILRDLEPHQDVLPETKSLQIGEIVIGVTVASTVGERAQGLSGTEILASDQGMLFVFEKSGFYPFWMKNMHYSLDIIWIDENGLIVDISKNISPDSYPTTYASSLPIRYVLEVNAGFSDLHQILEGMTVNFLN